MPRSSYPPGDRAPHARYAARRSSAPHGPRAASWTSLRRVLRAYPGTRSLGIVRACSAGGRSEHKEGRAWDWGGLNAARLTADRRKVPQPHGLAVRDRQVRQPPRQRHVASASSTVIWNQSASGARTPRPPAGAPTPAPTSTGTTCTSRSPGLAPTRTRPSGPAGSARSTGAPRAGSPAAPARPAPGYLATPTASAVAPSTLPAEGAASPTETVKPARRRRGGDHEGRRHDGRSALPDRGVRLLTPF